jgi:hypothetical protein
MEADIHNYQNNPVGLGALPARRRGAMLGVEQ